MWKAFAVEVFRFEIVPEFLHKHATFFWSSKNKTQSFLEELDFLKELDPGPWMTQKRKKNVGV